MKEEEQGDIRGVKSSFMPEGKAISFKSSRCASAQLEQCGSLEGRNSVPEHLDIRLVPSGTPEVVHQTSACFQETKLFKQGLKRTVTFGMFQKVKRPSTSVAWSDALSLSCTSSVLHRSNLSGVSESCIDPTFR